MTNSQRMEIAGWAVDFAKKSGASQSCATLSNSRNIELEYRKDKVDTLKDCTSNTLKIDIYAYDRFSTRSTSNLDKNSLKKFISSGVAATKYLSVDKNRYLPDAKYYPQGTNSDLEIYDKAYENVTIDQRKALAARAEAAALSKSDKIISVTSGCSDTYGQGVKIASNGFAGSWRSTRFTTWADVSVDGGAARPSGWSVSTKRFCDEMLSPETVGSEAAERALEKIGQTGIKSGKYDMIVENRCAAKIIRMLTRPMSGWALYQKRSFLDSKLNSPVASKQFTMIENPTVRKGLGSRHFDSEGMAAKKMPIIESGILKNYFLDSYYARKLGNDPTTGGASNLIFAQGDEDLLQLTKRMGRGILIKNFNGGNSNSTTGDFSFGISGQLIEKGRPVKPVSEMNISGNAIDLFKRLIACGNDPYPNGSWQTPSMLFKEVSFSGI